MKTTWNIGLLVAAAHLTGCENRTEAQNKRLTETYANPFGDEIKVECTTDTVMHVAFRNSYGYEVRTSVNIDPVSSNFGFPSLRLSTEYVGAHDGMVFISSSESIAGLREYCKIDQVHDFSFYRLDEKITIEGMVVHEKGGVIINDIFLHGGDEIVDHYARLTGIIKKEKYPVEYYSTPDSPQGMFHDTTKANYRLVLYDYVTEALCQKDTFTGTAITVDGQRAFQSDNDSIDVYYLADSVWKPWLPEEEGKRMKVAAVLDDLECCQSWLRAFEILD